MIIIAEHKHAAEYTQPKIQYIRPVITDMKGN